MVKRLVKGARSPTNPLYLNANLLFSECLNFIQKSWWKSHIKTDGTLNKLKKKGFDLLCSTLTRSEVLQKLRLEKNISLKYGRAVFQKVLEVHRIYLLSNLSQELNLTDEFFDTFARNKLTLGDYFHVRICVSLRIPMCTHDKKLIKYCTQSEKKRLYSKVFKPEDLLK